MDVAAKFGVVLRYYSRLCKVNRNCMVLYMTGIYVITTNMLNWAMPRQGCMLSPQIRLIVAFRT